MKKNKFKQKEIGSIPEGWEPSVFSEAISVNPRRALTKGTKAKYISMADLKEHNKKIQAFITRQYSGGSKFINGDTLMARITPCLENGKTAFVDILNKDEVGSGSTEFIVLAAKSDRTNEQYVYYLAISPGIQEKAIKSMTGTSGRQRVEIDAFDKIEINLPSLNEQYAIAKILSDLDDKIELNNQMNKTLEFIAQAIFKRWFVDFEFPDENGKLYKSSGRKMIDSELGEIPEGWEVKSLDQIADFLNGLALQKYPPEGDKYLPVIKIRELNQGITESTDKASPEIDTKYIVDDGDILFSWSGSLQVCIWCYGKGALNQHLFKVSSSEYPKWFYFYWVKFHLPEFQHIAQGKATTMGHIQRHHLSASLVVIPLKERLHNVSAIMTPLLDTIISNSVEIRKLSQIRDSLLPRLMSGKIRIGNPDLFKSIICDEDGLLSDIIKKSPIINQQEAVQSIKCKWDNSDALKIMIPDWDAFERRCAGGRDKANHISILVNAEMHDCLDRIIQPVNKFIVNNNKVRKDYANNLQEQWLDKNTEEKRYSSFNEFYGKIVELRVAERFDNHGYKIIDLQAWDDKSPDIVFRKNSITYNAEVKFIAQYKQYFLDSLNNSFATHATDFKSAADNLLKKVEGAKEQLLAYKIDTGQKIAVIVISALSIEDYFGKIEMIQNSKNIELTISRELEPIFKVAEKLSKVIIFSEDLYECSLIYEFDILKRKLYRIKI